MKNILEETAALFVDARGNVMQGIKNLYEIRDKGLWQEKCGSFTEYVEDVCQLDKSQVSRWLTTFEHFAIQGGVELTQLSEVNPERLYLARKLKGTHEKQFQKARLLSPQELRSELAVKDDGSEHECIPVTFCKVCRKRI